ncbi:MAG: hypothetical protein H6Q33_1535 [Deltaproteobacteria bacterium]|nr:hypothetical protein [Deltaproteobacteria bacterium]
MSQREMDDYSGPFRTTVTLEDFSKEGLKKLVEIGGVIYGNVNRHWYTQVAKEFGPEVADRLHHAVWFADGGCGDVENHTIGKLMGFANQNDETAPLKVWQCLPAMISRMKLVFEKKGDGSWEMHTPMCVVPETGEREGPAAMDYAVNKICGHLELFGFRHCAARWNPKIRIDPIKLPPRANASESHCRWSIRMTDEVVDYAADPGAFVKEHKLQRAADAEIVTAKAAGKYHTGKA